MPLFKKSGVKHDRDNVDSSQAGSGARVDSSTARSGVGSGGGEIPASTVTPARANPVQQATHGDHEFRGSQGYNQAPITDNPRSIGQPGITGQSGQPMAQGGNLPPTSHYSDADGRPQQGHSLSHAAGKVEHAMGTLIGSNALKARGQEKEQEASAFQTQSAELAEAEALEREATLHRQRAVAHGAHPDNRHLGGPAHVA